jgi:serine/threonine protein phosphatase PrpC
VFVFEGFAVKFVVSKKIQAGGSELQDRAEFFWNGPNLVLVLADGAGGLSGGAKAAQFVVESVKKEINTKLNSPEQLCSFLAALDRDMHGNGSFGETTGVILVLSNEKIIGASVGDSGALVISTTGVDHLTRSQIRKPLIGSGEAMPVAFERGTLDGTLLVASDGLLKYTPQEKIAATVAVSDLDGAADKLVSLVKYQSGTWPDDVSVLLAQVAS